MGGQKNATAFSSYLKNYHLDPTEAPLPLITVPALESPLHPLGAHRVCLPGRRYHRVEVVV